MASQPTLVHRLAHHAETRPDTPAIHGRNDDGTWRTYTWKQYWYAAREVAKGLMSLGLMPGDTVAIVGENQPEWVIAQLGIMMARGLPAPIYSTSTVGQVGYIVSHTRARFAICDKREQLEKLLAASAEETILVRHYVTTGEDASDIDTGVASLRTLDELRTLGREQPDDELERRQSEIKPDETGLLIFTSGTTGRPKGAELEHGSMTAAIDTILARYPMLDARSRVVSYLPLCHVAEQLVTNFGGLTLGCEAYFCPDLTRIKDYITEVRPTIFLGVPRVWEKFQAALEAKLAEASGSKAKLVAWALRTELACHRRRVESGRPERTLGRRLANQLVLSKIREKLGLDELVLAVSGAAPIAVATLDFFASIGIVIHEGFGMTETSGVGTGSDYGRPKAGLVGRALDGVEIRIAEDGEIQLRGRSMVKSYYRLLKETAELYTEDGWMRTGDLGELDADGNLKITGRKKEILITAGGKNVAPVEMEAHLQSIRGIGQAVVVGDRKPYLSALLSLDPEAIPEVCARLGLAEASIGELSGDDTLRAYLEREVEERCNAKIARYQTIKRFEVLPVEFSIDSGELTPTLKLRRSVIHRKYRAQIEGLYV